MHDTLATRQEANALDAFFFVRAREASEFGGLDMLRVLQNTSDEAALPMARYTSQVSNTLLTPH